MINDKLTFNNQEIFDGFYKNLSKIDSIIIKMLLDNHINIDGSLMINNTENIGKNILWTYIYYLWQHNKEIDVFKSMTNDTNGNASAMLFISTIIQKLRASKYKTDGSSYNTIPYNTNNTNNTYDSYDSDGKIDQDDLVMFIILIFKENNISVPVLEKIMDKIMHDIDNNWKEREEKKTLKIDIIL